MNEIRGQEYATKPTGGGERMSEDQASLSEDEEYIVNNRTPPNSEGTLNKWTNYIHGWQDRFIVLNNGTLTYFKSENEKCFGCRGAISIQKCQVKLHEFDECRFDVSVGDCVWYLRASNEDDRNKWVESIEAHRLRFGDSAYGSDASLRRHGSALSLGSVSATSFKKSRGLKDKLSELETFRDILCQQVDSLQKHFDGACTIDIPTNGVDDEDTKIYFQNGDDKLGNNAKDVEKSSVKDIPSNTGLDFKGEAITFKATTAGIISTLSHCIELMQQREESWKKRFDNEIIKRKKIEDSLKEYRAEPTHQKVIPLDGPDYEEGPHSKINEEEFFDALDAMLDRVDQQEEEKRQLKRRAKESRRPSSSLPEACDHQLWPEIDKVTLDQLYYARLEVGESDDPSGWHIFAEDGEMRLYKRELLIDGLVCDPLKAVHTVKGITGHEVCYHFFSPGVRWDWENTLESMKVAEEMNTNTLVVHQIHKRIWPAAQRDAVFWSHIRRITDIENKPDNFHDIWVVCNNSIENEENNFPLGRCVRMKLTVSMICETFIDPPRDGGEVTRQNLTCKIIYCSKVNPGGWAPASALRALYKREYPKFLKRFTEYVIDAQDKKPIMF